MEGCVLSISQVWDLSIFIILVFYYFLIVVNFLRLESFEFSFIKFSTCPKWLQFFFSMSGFPSLSLINWMFGFLNKKKKMSFLFFPHFISWRRQGCTGKCLTALRGWALICSACQFLWYNYSHMADFKLPQCWPAGKIPDKLKIGSHQLIWASSSAPLVLGWGWVSGWGVSFGEVKEIDGVCTKCVWHKK